MSTLISTMDAPVPPSAAVSPASTPQTGAVSSETSPVIRAWIAGLILVICLGLDQGSKVIASRTLSFEPWSYCGDTFRLQLAYNTGAFLGMAGQLSAETRFWLLTVLNGAFLVALAYFLVRYWKMAIGRFVACAGILAGGIGNLIDRATNDGQVTDFMNIGLGPVRSGIFNVADMAITGGALLLAWYWWREEQPASAAR